MYGFSFRLLLIDRLILRVPHHFLAMDWNLCDVLMVVLAVALQTYRWQKLEHVFSPYGDHLGVEEVVGESGTSAASTLSSNAQTENFCSSWRPSAMPRILIEPTYGFAWVAWGLSAKLGILEGGLPSVSPASTLVIPSAGCFLDPCRAWWIGVGETGFRVSASQLTDRLSMVVLPDIAKVPSFLCSDFSLRSRVFALSSFPCSGCQASEM